MTPAPDPFLRATDVHKSYTLGRRTLEAMERLRENRVKQLSSRIVEAALGVGKESKSQDRRDVTRPRERVFDPCHAVVIENLRRYKSDEKQTRRENRQPRINRWLRGTRGLELATCCERFDDGLGDWQTRQEAKEGKRIREPVAIP